MELTISERRALHAAAAIWDAEAEDNDSELAKQERERCLRMLGFFATRYEDE